MHALDTTRTEQPVTVNRSTRLARAIQLDCLLTTKILFKPAQHIHDAWHDTPFATAPQKAHIPSRYHQSLDSLMNYPPQCAKPC